MLYHFHSSAWVVTLGDWDDFSFGYNVSVCCLLCFYFPPLRILEAVILSATHVTLRLLAAPPLSSTCQRSSWRSPLLLQTSLNEQHSHTDTDRSLIHVLKSIHLQVFFLCQSTQHLYISPETRLKERCPKECVYKLPVNTLSHALMHARTRTHQQCTSPWFPLCGHPVRICPTRSLRSAS